MYREIKLNNKGILIDINKNTYLDIKKPTILFLRLNALYSYNGIHYYILDGQGSINIEAMPHYKPIFNKVNRENLAYYVDTLCHSSIDYEEQKQIELFYKIYMYNASYNKPVLYNNAYMELEKKLFLDLHDVTQRNIKIEKY